MSFPTPIKKTLAAGLAAATLSVLAVASTPAEARMGFGGMHGFGGFHPGFGAFHGAAFAPRPFMHAGFARRPFFVNRFHHRSRFGTAFAIGAGLGLASAYAYPYYGYGYYPAAYGYGDECYVVRRRYWNPWGVLVVRRQLVCD